MRTEIKESPLGKIRGEHRQKGGLGRTQQLPQQSASPLPGRQHCPPHLSPPVRSPPTPGQLRWLPLQVLDGKGGSSLPHLLPLPLTLLLCFPGRSWPCWLQLLQDLWENQSQQQGSSRSLHPPSLPNPKSPLSQPPFPSLHAPGCPSTPSSPTPTPFSPLEAGQTSAAPPATDLFLGFRKQPKWMPGQH